MSTSNYDVDLMERLRELEGLHLVATRTGLPADRVAYEAAKAEVERLMERESDAPDPWHGQASKAAAA